MSGQCSAWSLIFKFSFSLFHLHCLQRIISLSKSSALAESGHERDTELCSVGQKQL